LLALPVCQASVYATAPFIVRRLLVNFVTPSPSDAYVARLAGALPKNDDC